MTQPIQLVVMDMAGTTLQDPGVVEDCFARAARDTGLDMTDDEILAIQGQKKRWVFEEAWAQQLGARGEAWADHVERSFQAFRDTLEAHYRAHPVAPTEGALDTFAALRARGVRVALTTGFYRRVTDLLLDQVGWLAPLDETYLGPHDAPVQLSLCSDDVEDGRPAPDMIFLAMSRFGIEDAALVANVGDTPSDLGSAAAAGCRYNLGVTNGTHARGDLEAHPHDALLDSLADLVSWLDSRGALPPRTA